MENRTKLSLIGALILLIIAAIFASQSGVLNKFLPTGFVTAEALTGSNTTDLPAAETEEEPVDLCAGFVPEYNECPADTCGGSENYYWIDFPESGYSTCEEGVITEWNCNAVSEEYSTDCVRKTATFNNRGSGGYSGLSGDSAPKVETTIAKDTNVPEFSTVTLAAAVAIAGLGIAFLRKR